MVSFGKINEENTVLQTRYLINNIIFEDDNIRVYKGKDLKTEKTIVVKELSMDNFSGEREKRNNLKHFELEINLFTGLFHTGLPRYLNQFEFNDKKYMIMTYLEGEKLNRFIAGRKYLPSEEEVVNQGIELCDILVYLHKKNSELLVYIGLSGENVILTEDGNLKLTEFGKFSLFSPQPPSSSKGPSKYFSPMEHYTSEVDEKSDVYSLGAILYFLATGNPPVDAYERTLHGIALPPCRHFNSNISPGLETIIFKALELDKKNRFESLLEMKEALENPCPEPLPEKETEFVTRRLTGENSSSKKGFLGGLFSLFKRS